eukprot:TRINITY_DN69704_c0_g1_i1.p1 TRINITY_DN69704_c0_g1~~TRINITY_DN69704_c0_g1_i1.p1  ORF type:complete len:782 (+),score=90.55 TRINITY_DN69704_c0_g1_i1:61-2406(+)
MAVTDNVYNAEEIGDDVAWETLLSKELENATLCHNLVDAIRPMFPYFLPKTEWELESFTRQALTRMKRLAKQHRYNLQYAGAIYLWTCEEPRFYYFVNMALNSPRRMEHGMLSEELAACLPYVKFLDEALTNLPDEFVHTGRCWRAVDWVYPSLRSHDPVTYFPRGREFYWFSFKSATADYRALEREKLQKRSGVCTIFQIENATAFKVWRFSAFPREKEVLFCPLTMLVALSVCKRVVVARAKYNDPSNACHSGRPDVVVVNRVDGKTRIPLPSLPRAFPCCHRRVSSHESSLPRLLQIAKRFPADRGYTILALGQTGTGKTSFLNLLAGIDDVAGCQAKDLTIRGLEDFVNAKITDEAYENHKDDPMASKTSRAITYTVTVGDAVLNIIDTPGPGDTSGLRLDQEHASSVVACVEEVVTVDCVMIFVNGRDARMNATVAYALAMLANLLPREIFNSIVVVFTNTQDADKLSFNPASIKDLLDGHQPPFVCLENPHCFLAKRQVTKEYIDENRVSISNDLRIAEETIATLFTIMDSFRPIPTTLFANVKEAKDRVELLIDNLHCELSDERGRMDYAKELEAKIRHGEEVKRSCARMFLEWRMVESSANHVLCYQRDCHCCRPFLHQEDIPTNWSWRFGFTDNNVHKLSRKGPCNCKHQAHHHRAAKRVWRSEEKTEYVLGKAAKKIVASGNAAAIDLKDVAEYIEQCKERQSKIVKQLERALEEYSLFGLPKAFSRLMRAQRRLLEQQIVDRPDDESSRQLLKVVDRRIAEIESRFNNKD